MYVERVILHNSKNITYAIWNFAHSINMNKVPARLRVKS